MIFYITLQMKAKFNGNRNYILSHPAQHSCAHSEHDTQWIHLSLLAEFRKVSLQKIQSVSSSSFQFSLLGLLVSCLVVELWIFSSVTAILSYTFYCLVALFFLQGLSYCLVSSRLLLLGLHFLLSFTDSPPSIFSKGRLLERQQFQHFASFF